MRITFTETAAYSENGLDVMRGHKGETREVAHTAACMLLSSGKAFNAEPETDNKRVSQAIDDIHSVIRHIDKWYSELHVQMDRLDKMLHPDNAALLPLPNKALSGTYFPGMTAVRASEENAA